MNFNLISCHECGIVLDKNKLRFPKNIYNPDGTINTEKAEWNGEKHVACIYCPVCSTKILKFEKYNEE